MVIQTVIDTGDETKTTIHRNIKPYELPRWRESFYSRADIARSGKLYQLKGNQHILIAKF